MERLVKVHQVPSLKDQVFIFHKWGDVSYPGESNDYPVARGIIEEIITGKVYQVEPRCIQFLSEDEAQMIRDQINGNRRQKLTAEILKNRSID